MSVNSYESSVSAYTHTTSTAALQASMQQARLIGSIAVTADKDCYEKHRCTSKRCECMCLCGSSVLCVDVLKHALLLVPRDCTLR
jgi:hypothetical protein